MMASTSNLTTENFDKFNEELQSVALKATRNSLLLPSDISYHKSMDHELATELDLFSTRLLRLTNKLIGLNGKGKARLESKEDVLDNFHSIVVDAMDQLLEKADICLDQLTGRIKAPAIALNPPEQKKSNKKAQIEVVVQHAAHLTKPQLAFKTPVDNSDTSWYPTLKHKYNAQVPLGYHSDAESGVEQV
jgi:exosome complex exonuclease RRP6